MYARQLLLGALAAASLASASAIDGEEFFAVLLKRQEPGTPAYNCHDNCGNAIRQAREVSDVCDNKAFQSNYANCLQCAGPDNFDIWKYYGNSVSAAGSKCSLSTEPLSGKQPDVGPATNEDDAGGSEPSTSGGTPSPTDTEPEPSVTAGPTSSNAPEPSSGGDGDAESTAETPSATGSASPTGGSDASATASGTSSAPSSTSSEPVQVNGAGVLQAVGVFEAVAIGALFFI